MNILSAQPRKKMFGITPDEKVDVYVGKRSDGSWLIHSTNFKPSNGERFFYKVYNNVDNMFQNWKFYKPSFCSNLTEAHEEFLKHFEKQLTVL